MDTKINIKKINEKHYRIQLNLINQSIDNKMIDDFSLITMLFNLNKDHFVDGMIQTIHNDSNNKVIMILVKPICKEFGFNQRYLFLELVRTENGQIYSIKGKPCSTQSILPITYQNLINSPNIINTPLSNITFSIDKTISSKIDICIDFELDNTFYSFPMFDTLIKTFLKSIFKKLQHAYSLIPKPN